MMDESKDRAPRQGWTGSGNRMRYKGDLYGFRHSPKFLSRWSSPVAGPCFPNVKQAINFNLLIGLSNK